MSLQTKLNSLISSINDITGEEQTDLTSAIQDLADGYGQGGLSLHITVTAPAGSTVTCTKGSIVLTATSTGAAIDFSVPEAGTWTVTATKDTETATENVIVKSNYSKTLVFSHIYGAEWDGSASTEWTRTDEAANFADPIPYYAGMVGTPSSPFDNCAPWKDITVIENETAGTLVRIPKFWYKWTTNGSNMKLQISNVAAEGFFVSPAHADRNDGQGERDFVYVGKYACDTAYKSTASVASTALPSEIRANQRSLITSLGTGFYLYDFAMLWTIGMLYLVEFANWNMRAKIGVGKTDYTTGETNAIAYHTGTTATERTIGGMCKYRNIEGLWNDAFNLDGITNNGYTEYINKNPTLYAEEVTHGIQMGAWRCGGTTSTWTRGTTQGYEWVLFPSAINGNDANIYTCATYAHDWVAGWFGTVTGAIESASLFTLHQWLSAGSWANKARLQYLPAAS